MTRVLGAKGPIEQPKPLPRQEMVTSPMWNAGGSPKMAKVFAFVTLGRGVYQVLAEIAIEREINVMKLLEQIVNDWIVARLKEAADDGTHVDDDGDLDRGDAAEAGA